MINPIHTIEIDRIVLTDLGVTKDRAERIRALVGVELNRLLERAGVQGEIASGAIFTLQVPTLRVPEHTNDQQLANGLARGIAQSLGGVE